MNRKGFAWDPKTAELFKAMSAHKQSPRASQGMGATLSLSWSRRRSWHRSDLLLPGEGSTRCSGRRGQVSSCLDVFKKMLEHFSGKMTEGTIQIKKQEILH